MRKIGANAEIMIYRPKRQVLGIVALSVAFVCLLAVAFLTRFYLLASLIGIGFGVLIAPFMNLMQERFKIPRGLSALAIVVLVIGGVIGFVYGLFVLLSDQIRTLIDQFPQIVDTLQHQVNRLFANYPWLEGQVRRLNLGQTVRTTLSTLTHGLQTGVTALAGFVVILTLAIFTAVSSRDYLHGLLSLFPAYLRSEASEVLERSGSVLRKWFRSQLIVMAISGSATTLGLWILGIQYWLLLGVLAGVLGFIPYIGAFLTVIVAALVTLGSEPGKIGWVLGVYFAIQQLEGNLIIPLVMRGGVRIPEAHLIVFMLVMGSLFGLLGIFSAPPILAVARNIYLMTYVPRMNHRTDQSSGEDLEDAHQNEN